MHERSEERRARLEEAFCRACELPSEERDAFLEEECSGDRELLEELLSLVRLDGLWPEDSRPRRAPAPPSSLFQESPSGRLLHRLAASRAGLERYEVRGEFARGGMGAILDVWDQDFQRHSAMKVILDDGGGRSREGDRVDERTLGRFLEEARITGQLEHPGIVPVHEMGLDAEGRVYFTMQLVQGRSLHEVFALAGEGEDGWTRERALNALLKVCEAMSYAHTKGVIHRDLKPSNVMVGRFGEVYVMDWGLAHVLSEEDTKDIRVREAGSVFLESLRRDDRGASPDSPLLTMDGDVVGTPSFMPPEQARGELERVDRRSDVYALGAMLYELLTGRAPYTIPEARVSPQAVLAKVLSGSPQPVRDAAPDAHDELVSICEKAMQRDAGKRYPSVSELADDLRAFLEGRVVKAHAEGALQELRKWVQRNRGFAAASAAAILLTTTGGGLLAWQSERAAADIRRERTILESVVDLQKDILTIDAWEDGAEVRALELVERAAARIGDTYAGQPEVEAEVRTALGDSFLSLGAYEAGLEQRRLVYERFLRLHGQDDQRTEETALELAAALRLAGRTEEALNRYRDLRARFLETRGALDDSTLVAARGVVECLFVSNRLEEAEREAAGLLDQESAALSDAAKRELLHVRRALGNSLLAQGDVAAAEAHFVELRGGWTALEGPESPNAASATTSLATAYMQSGRVAEASEALAEVVDLRSARLGRGHVETLKALENLAQARAYAGDLEGALDLQKEVLTSRERAFSREHPSVARAALNLTATLGRLGRAEEAVAMLEPICRSVAGMSGPADMVQLAALINASHLRRVTGDVAGAIVTGFDAVAVARRSLPDDHYLIASAEENLALALDDGDRHGEALEHFRRTLELRRRVLGRQHVDTVQTSINLARSLAAHGEEEEAYELLSESREGAGEEGESRLTEEIGKL